MLQLEIHSPFGLLGVLDRLCLKGVNGFYLPANVISHWLESLDVALYLIDDGLVLQARAVRGKVDRLGRGR